MRVDPITFKVVNNALHGVAEQMAATILRTSYSTVVREMLDYSTAVFDPAGRIIAQSCRIPIHLNSMSRSLRTTLEQAIPIGEWKPGDIIVTNDPFLGGQHLPDVQTFLPVFADGELVAICGTLDHHLDIGGMRPASYAGDAVEIYQEGLRLPPIKLFEEGRLNERLFALIAANIRQPEQTIGDLRAQAAALEIGRDGVLELVARYGAKTIADCMEDAVDSSELRLRSKLRELPAGTYEAEYFIDDDGVTDERIRVATRITIGDGTIHAYDLSTNTRTGTLASLDSTPIVIDGLRALGTGNGGNGGDPQSLYFTAGPGGGTHGLLGVITALPEPGVATLLGAGLIGLVGAVRSRKRSVHRRPAPAREWPRSSMR